MSRKLKIFAVLLCNFGELLTFAFYSCQVVKKAGLIIKPIRFEDVDPHEKVENNRSRRQQQQMSNRKSKGKSNKI